MRDRDSDLHARIVGLAGDRAQRPNRREQSVSSIADPAATRRCGGRRVGRTGVGKRIEQVPASSRAERGEIGGGEQRHAHRRPVAADRSLPMVAPTSDCEENASG